MDQRRRSSDLKWCRRTNRALLYLAEVPRFGPGSIRTRDMFLSALTLLEVTGWIEKEQRGVVLVRWEHGLKII